MNILRKIALASFIALALPASASLAQSQPITLEGDVKVVKQVIEEGGETRTVTFPTGFSTWDEGTEAHEIVNVRHLSHRRR